MSHPVRSRDPLLSRRHWVVDFEMDLRAGRAAGVATVLVDRRGRGAAWAPLADRVVRRLDDLLEGARD